jgi:anti-sigma regulatory factor (Ser/Thr protein kinase)
MRRPSTSEREFDKKLAALEAVFEFLDATLSATALDERGRFVLQLAVEELFTNMVKYGSDLGGRVAVRVTTEPDRVRVDIVDPNTHDFDPTRLPAVDTTRPIQERTRGGLGLHLVREMADGVEYRYRDREMTVSVTKHLE